MLLAPWAVTDLQAQEQEPKAPAISTDKADYAPGDHVVVTGENWAPGEGLRLVLTADPPAYPDRIHAATADESGRFENREFLVEQHDLGVTFTLVVTSETSGLSARTQFTDSDTVIVGGGPIAYDVTESTGSIAHGPVVTDVGNNCDDCTTLIRLPFAYTLYGRSFPAGSALEASSNGVLEFASNIANVNNKALPTSDLFAYSIFGHWDDLYTLPRFTDVGVRTSTSGVAPDRVFHIEWNAAFFAARTNRVNFEIRLFEGHERFEIVYGRVDSRGSSATVGAQLQCVRLPSGSCSASLSQFTQYSFNESTLFSGLRLIFERKTVSSVAEATGFFGGQTTLQATLTDRRSAIADADIAFTMNGARVGTATTDASGVATLTGVSLSGLDAQVYAGAITASFAGNASLAASRGTATLTVTQAPASINVTGGSFTYDGSGHPATGSVTGVTGEDLGLPTFTYTDANGTTTATAPVNVGTYIVNASFAGTSNYLAGSNGSVTIVIDPAPMTALTVTANNASRVYGDQNPAFTASFSGFVAGEDESVLDGTLTFTTPATAASAVGTYAVTPAGLSSPNYVITYVDGMLTITPAPLTVRVNGASKVYGEVLPAFGATYAGFVPGEGPNALGGTLSLNTLATQASDVGSYAVTANGLESTNYAITYAAGTLTITPAPLTITADDKTSVFGAPLPAFTASYAGFVLGQNPWVLSGTFTTTATAASVPGSYPIAPIGQTSGNYAITYVNGTLTITFNSYPLYNPTKVHRAGSTIPIKLMVGDALGRNVSSPDTVLHAVEVVQLSTSTAGAPEDAGNANPDGDFRFTSYLGQGSYIFNLKTTGLSTGTYRLTYSITGDPLLHSTLFQVR